MEKPSQGRANKVDSIACFFILCVMVLIAIAVLIKQNRYDPTIFNPDILTTAEGLASQKNIQPLDMATIVPSGFTMMDAKETYGPADLYVKINGKADLYLESGFNRLMCLRFINQTEEDAWAELFLFDMGTAKNAFAVFSM